MKRKNKMILLLLIAVMLVFTACNDEGDQGKSTEAEQTTGAPVEESSTVPEETESQETSNSLIVSVFDGDKDMTYLKKYGLTTYQTALANLDAVNNIRYVDIGDGAEIYKGGVFCGWFAAWDFGGASNAGEADVIGAESIDGYMTDKFGSENTISCVRTGKQNLADGITRYDFDVQVLAQGDDQWMVSTGMYRSEAELNARKTYTLAVSAYCAADSNCGFILCLEKDEMSERLLEKVREAVSFKKSSFTEGRATLQNGQPAQEIFTTVETQYTFVKDYLQRSQWFNVYNGEKLQRIAGTTDNNYSPAKCPDILFYRADAGESMEAVVETMFRAIMDPLKVPSAARTFTVTGYFLDEQQILVYESEENMWLLPLLNGYYAYEGTDSVTMDMALNGDEAKDGMVPLYRQGSSDEFQYILVREGNVYRLQRAKDMGLEIKGQEK